ncbi:MAG: hypothetical protein PHP07_08575 [Eubacteriales bacterium]|nr:hypothetical protein [Eubacteriales bacterium]
MMKKTMALLFSLVLILSSFHTAGLAETHHTLLSDAKAYVQQEMDGLKTALAALGRDTIGLPAADPSAYAALNSALNSRPYFFDLVICDSNTDVLHVATVIDGSWIGLNLDSIDRMGELFIQTPAFVMKPLASADDTPFIYCSVPVEGRGWVIAIIDPYSFGASLTTLSVGQNVEFGLITTDGTNIYSGNMTEISRNVLTDPMYAEFESLRGLIQEHMLPQRQGEGEYTFYASGMGSLHRKTIVWDTVTAFETDLRIYANTEPAGEETAAAARPLRGFAAEEMAWLDSAKALITEAFTQADALGASAAEAYAAQGGDSKAFLDALEEYSRQSPLVRNVFFVNSEQFIASAYPAYNAGFAWADRFTGFAFDISASDTPFFHPPVTGADHDAPSVLTMGLGHPVHVKGERVGWIIGMVRVYDLAAYLTRLQALGQNINFTLSTLDGLVLYDGDMVEIGKNLLADPVFTQSESLQAFVRDELMPLSGGSSEYTFYGAGMTQEVLKRVAWSTLSLNGMELKLAMNSEWQAE